MVHYERIEEYVALCQRALRKETPLDKIEALSRAKKIMRKDLVLFWTNIKASSNWIKWWWYAVDCVHGDYYGNVRHFVGWDKTIDFDNIMEWVECLDNSETMYSGLREDYDIGPGCEHEEIGFFNEPEKWIDYPETYAELNEQYPLQPTERKPIVTPLDVVFRELLWVWSRAVRRLTRDAVVDGQVKNTEDAEPPEYLTDDYFIDTLIIPSQTPGKSGSEESRSVEDNTAVLASILEEGKNKKVPKKEAGTIPLSFQETPPQKEGMKDHIDEIDEKTARCLYKALSNKEEPRKVDWLVAPLDENEFVRRLFANPPNPEKKITLEKPSQVKHITEHYLFPKDKPKKGRERKNYTHGEWDVIKQIFDTMPVTKNRFDTAGLNPQNFQNLDALMRTCKRNSKNS